MWEKTRVLWEILMKSVQLWFECLWPKRSRYLGRYIDRKYQLKSKEISTPCPSCYCLLLPISNTSSNKDSRIKVLPSNGSPKQLTLPYLFFGLFGFLAYLFLTPNQWFWEMKTPYKIIGHRCSKTEKRKLIRRPGSDMSSLDLSIEWQRMCIVNSTWWVRSFLEFKDERMF